MARFPQKKSANAAGSSGNKDRFIPQVFHTTYTGNGILFGASKQN